MCIKTAHACFWRFFDAKGARERSGRAPNVLILSILGKQMSIIDAGVTGPLLREAMEAIRAGLNPHPAGQKTLNVPSYDGEQVRRQHLGCCRHCVVFCRPFTDGYVAD